MSVQLGEILLFVAEETVLAEHAALLAVENPAFLAFAVFLVSCHSHLRELRLAMGEPAIFLKPTRIGLHPALT